MKDKNTNKTKEVKINIRSVQDGVETSLMVSDGKMTSDKKDNYFIEFDGTEICGVSGEKVSFQIDGQDKVVMTTGKRRIISQIVLEMGVRHHCHYNNEFSDLITVGISTRKIKSTLNENGGDVEVDYSIEFNNSVASDNQMYMSITKQ